MATSVTVLFGVLDYVLLAFFGAVLTCLPLGCVCCAGLIDYNIDCFKTALQRLFEGAPERGATRALEGHSDSAQSRADKGYGL